VSVPPAAERERPADAIAGFLAAAAIFVSLMGLATGIGGRNARLAQLAVACGAACFAVGMALAVLTGHPLY
jgi:hypothetical protein